MITVEEYGKMASFRVQCIKCESILRYNIKDEHVSVQEESPYGAIERYSIYCPVCGGVVMTRVCGKKYNFDFRLKDI